MEYIKKPKLENQTVTGVKGESCQLPISKFLTHNSIKYSIPYWSKMILKIYFDSKWCRQYHSNFPGSSFCSGPGQCPEKAESGLWNESGLPGHTAYTVAQVNELPKSLMLCCYSLEILKNFIFELVFCKRNFETMKPVHQQKRYVQ